MKLHRIAPTCQPLARFNALWFLMRDEIKVQEQAQHITRAWGDTPMCAADVRLKYTL
jgi:hypothetical protein